MFLPGVGGDFVLLTVSRNDFVSFSTWTASFNDLLTLPFFFLSFSFLRCEILVENLFFNSPIFFAACTRVFIDLVEYLALVFSIACFATPFNCSSSLSNFSLIRVTFVPPGFLLFNSLAFTICVRSDLFSLGSITSVFQSLLDHLGFAFSIV